MVPICKGLGGGVEGVGAVSELPRTGIPSRGLEHRVTFRAQPQGVESRLCATTATRYLRAGPRVRRRYSLVRRFASTIMFWAVEGECCPKRLR